MISPSNTHAASIADKLTRRNERAFRLQSLLRKRGAALTRIFIQDGILLWRFKCDELWRELGAASMDSWVADPDNKQDSASKVHLQIQVIETCWRYFEVDRKLLYGVGYRKWQLLMPEIELYRQRVIDLERQFPEVEHKHWDVSRFRVLWLIHSAQSLTVSSLQSLLIENSIAYSGDGSEDASTPLNGAHSGHWDVLRERTPIVASVLHEMTKDEIIGWLGLSDITGQVYIQVVKAREGE